MSYMLFISSSWRAHSELIVDDLDEVEISGLPAIKYIAVKSSDVLADRPILMVIDRVEFARRGNLEVHLAG